MITEDIINSGIEFEPGRSARDILIVSIIHDEIPQIYIMNAYYKEINKSVNLEAFPDSKQLCEYMIYWLAEYIENFDLSSLKFDPPV